MAHELSHIVLHSLWHKEKDNEIYTDITAMMLGFSVIMKIGRKVIKTSTSADYGILSNATTTRTETTTYGYLSDENFHFAFSKIAKILDRSKEETNKLINEMKELTKKVHKNKKIMIYFQKYLEFIDKNFNQAISPDDGYKISTFHQVGYMDEFKQVISKIENELKRFNNYVASLKHYNENVFNTINQHEEKLRIFASELDLNRKKLRADVGILKKYVSLTSKFKIFIEMFNK